MDVDYLNRCKYVADNYDLTTTDLEYTCSVHAVYPEDVIPFSKN